MTIDYLTFFAIIIKALAWPLAVVAIALLFQGDLRKLLRRFKKGKLGAAELEFAELVKETAEDNAIPVNAQAAVSPPALELASDDTQSTIIKAWVKVENAIRSLAAKSDVSGSSISQLARSLERAGVISADDISLFNDLRVLRNQAAHDPNFNPAPDAAITFAQLANGFANRLRAYGIGPSFVVRQTRLGAYTFTLRATNGEAILSSDAYSSKAGALNGIEAVRINSSRDDRYTIASTSNGRYSFRLLASNGEVIGASELYASEGALKKAMDLVKRIAPGAPINDLTS